jgi:hypothetical protein
MTRAELERVRKWALEKLATGEEPPWAWYQYMKLRETLDVILAGMDSVKPPDLLESERHSGKHLRLAASTGSRESTRPHSTGKPVRLPM